MNTIKTILAGVLLPAFLAFQAMAAPTRPTDEVKDTADRIMAILRDPSLQGDAHKGERRRLMREVLDRRFDWLGIARSSLGRHWAKRSPAEQQEFVKLFSEFLERTYLDKFEVYYSTLDKMDYQGEKIIENYASVKSVLTTKEKVEHPVEYRLQHSTSGQPWRIYDVIIEGVSLVNNYRAQFDEIIAKSSYEKLVADLRQKLAPETH